VRLTVFWERMREQFGPLYADSVARDQVIRQLGDRTVYEALADGDDVRSIWLAVCEHYEIPVSARH
jgi:Protein of unknown function (DUF3046)